MENQIAEYYEAIAKHYKISDSEYNYKDFNNYTLIEINNDLFVVMTEYQISAFKDRYIEDIVDSVYLPFRFQHLETYIDKEQYAKDCWEESDEAYFIDNLIEDDGFRFTYINTLHEIPFL